MSATYGDVACRTAALTPAAKPRFVGLRCVALGDGCCDPLSKTITFAGRIVCRSIDARHSAVIAPPSKSRTITSTSLMPHPIEAGGSVETAQRHASRARQVDRLAEMLPTRRRQLVLAAIELDARRRAGGVLEPRRAGAREERHRLPRLQRPAAAVEEALDRVDLGVEIAAAVDDVRVLELDH